MNATIMPRAFSPAEVEAFTRELESGQPLHAIRSKWLHAGQPFEKTGVKPLPLHVPKDITAWELGTLIRDRIGLEWIEDPRTNEGLVPWLSVLFGDILSSDREPSKPSGYAETGKTSRRSEKYIVSNGKRRVSRPGQCLILGICRVVRNADMHNKSWATLLSIPLSKVNTRLFQHLVGNTAGNGFLSSPGLMELLEHTFVEQSKGNWTHRNLEDQPTGVDSFSRQARDQFCIRPLDMMSAQEISPQTRAWSPSGGQDNSHDRSLARRQDVLATR